MDAPEDTPPNAIEEEMMTESAIVDQFLQSQEQILKKHPLSLKKYSTNGKPHIERCACGARIDLEPARLDGESVCMQCFRKKTKNWLPYDRTYTPGNGYSDKTNGFWEPMLRNQRRPWVRDTSRLALEWAEGLSCS